MNIYLEERWIEMILIAVFILATYRDQTESKYSYQTLPQPTCPSVSLSVFRYLKRWHLHDVRAPYRSNNIFKSASLLVSKLA